MRSKLIKFGAAALAALLITSTGARADFVETKWSYNASTITRPNPDDPGGAPLEGIGANAGPNPLLTSSVSFTGSSGSATNDSGIIVYTLKSFSQAARNKAEAFNDVPFQLAIKVTDSKANGLTPDQLPKAGTVKASDFVYFNGTFNANNVSKESFVAGDITYDMAPQKLTLGSTQTGWNEYTIKISSFTPPGAPGGSDGSIYASVTVTPGTPDDSGEGPPDGEGPPNPNAAPEPASLVLAGLGLPVALIARRRRQKAAAQV